MLMTAGSTRQVPTQRLRMCCLTKLAYQGSLAYCAGNAHNQESDYIDRTDADTRWSTCELLQFVL